MQNKASANQDTMTCACAILHRDGNFLVARRSSKKRFYPDVWDFPGGHVRVGESIEAALIREVREEIGVVPTDYRLVQVLRELKPEQNGNGVYHIFLVSVWIGGEPWLSNIEHTELRWCPVEDVLKLDLADARYVELLKRVSTSLE